MADPPKLVHLRKVNGTVVQGCDIYIGNQINNPSWNLKQSKWSDPFHSLWNVPLTQRLDKYKQHILKQPQLVNDLGDLRGKTLGCLCKDISSCHGNVLIKLVKMKYSKDYMVKAVRGNVYMFKGSLSPFSNFYPVPLRKEAENKDNTTQRRIKRYPLGTGQMYVMKRASDAGRKDIEEQVRLASSIQEINNLSKSIPPFKKTVEDQVTDMFHLQNLKYSQVGVMKKGLQRLASKGRVPCEATNNKFWGCGADLSKISSMNWEKMKEAEILTGRNLFGWILCMVYAYNSNRNFYWLPLLQDMPPSMQEGFKIVSKILAERGILHCPYHQDEEVEKQSESESQQGDGQAQELPDQQAGNALA